MSEQKKPTEMSPEERRRLIEQRLAEQRKKPEYRSFQESLKEATRVTDSDLRFKVS